MSQTKENHRVYMKNRLNDPINSKRFQQNRLKRRKELRAWFYDIKSKYSCNKCGESDPICLDFHHTSGNKDFQISTAVHVVRSKENILKEIEKCVILCSNCHRKEHANKYRP